MHKGMTAFLRSMVSEKTKGMTAFLHATVLDGTKEMKRLDDATVTMEDGIIMSVEEGGCPPKGARRVDLTGKYLLPGLINLHCHLAGDGRPQKIDSSTAELMQSQMENDMARFIMKKMAADCAKTALLSGITTIRTVGGMLDLDARVRDEILEGKQVGPRILAANEAVSVPGGHMAGTLARVVRSADEAGAMVKKIAEGSPDLIKLMVTGGTLDIEKPGDEGKVLMTEEEIAVATRTAHELGYKVSAHVQSADGIFASLKNGVDTIEHGASLNEELVALFKERNAALISTITPVAIMACLPNELSGLPKLYSESCELYMREIIKGFQRAVAEGIPIGLGLDDGSPYVTHYCMWRELDFFTRYIGVKPEFALWCATGQNAKIAGIGDVTGTIERGKAADFLIVEDDPLADFSRLGVPCMVVARGEIYRRPKWKRYKEIDNMVDNVKKYDARFVAGGSGT